MSRENPRFSRRRRRSDAGHENGRWWWLSATAIIIVAFFAWIQGMAPRDTQHRDTLAC